MDALRRWRPAVKGATPTAPADDPTAGGRHERAMMVALLVNMSAGTALGYASVSMPRIELESWYNLQPQAHVNQSVADILLLGAAAGALFSGQLLHLLGTRITLLLSAFGQINSWICVVVSNNVTMLFIGRVTCGIWLGVSANSVSLYICDVAPPTKRTFFGALTEDAVGVPAAEPAAEHVVRTARAAARRAGSGPPGGRDGTTRVSLPGARHARQLRDPVRRPDPLHRPPPAAHLLGSAGRRRPVHLASVRLHRLQVSSPIASPSHWSPAQASTTRFDALCSVCLLVLAYSTGLCHVPSLVISELLPLKRWRYLSASLVWELLRAGDFESLSLAFGLAVLLVAAAAIPFVPETEGRTLADIHREE
ncbi:uncharacterized protein LOC125946328 [Dermacentor silvarum]|uniref:uncharacterized protein LOC125946328 n=1 Tax=Dermacentor silvarum TaxID=543639 RepID=UPI0021013909|nr:uncharacterized protein LOC125946328 [Dermacentor silvarum]